jgi:phosphatidylinositol alpha-1,6-mannosyltransferase
MNAVAVTVESRYIETPDGCVWTLEGPDYTFFQRYLGSFDAVNVIARVAQRADAPSGAHTVAGPGVAVHRLPYYHGPRQFLAKWYGIRRALTDAAKHNDAFIFRVPSTTGSVLAPLVERLGKAFALEVMGDPDDVFAPGVVRHPLRPLLRSYYTRKLRRLAASAYGVSYVTESYLQQKYPASSSAVTATYSSIDLTPDAFAADSRPERPTPSVVNLLSVGTLDQLYKGVDTAIEAVRDLRNRGLDVRLAHIGDGLYRKTLENMVDRMGLSDHVQFLGRLPAGPSIRAHLDEADIFVMPSRTEGLPKALIEAMARGTPALGTCVGGIPELLGERYLVPPDSPKALADAVARLVAAPEELAHASQVNLATARRFESELLAAKRRRFYAEFRNMALEHRVQHAASTI